MFEGITNQMLQSRPELSVKDNRIYKIFNYLLIAVIVLVSFIGIFLLVQGIYLGFFICVGELIFFVVLLKAHLNGYFNVSRYVFFVFAILTQVFGSLYHGETGGFDFLFFTTALTPVLFFNKRNQYSSLFILSMATYLMVKYLYGVVDPVYVFETSKSPYYVNILISALLVYFGYDMFKQEHLKHEEELQVQRDQIEEKNHGLTKAHEQMHQLLKSKTKDLESQNEDIGKYADMNAHIIRSPLARILGLTNLAKYEKLESEKVRKYYVQQLQYNANELDNSLRKINQILSRYMD